MTAKHHVLVINPNTSDSVTQRLALQLGQGWPQAHIHCATAPFGAPYIADEYSYCVAGHAVLQEHAALRIDGGLRRRHGDGEALGHNLPSLPLTPVEKELTQGQEIPAAQPQTAAALLGHNFPESPWYKDAYNLVKSNGLEPSENKSSWMSRALRKVGLG